MNITKKQLRSLIAEAMPAGGVPDVVGAVTGVYGEEQRQLLDDLGGMYSDMHKELYGRRPKIPMFKTIEEAEAAVDEIWAEYAAVNRAREEQEQQDLEYMEMERRMQELMPGVHDIELPMRSGMGRRTESIMKISKRQLRRIIKEEKGKLIKEEMYADPNSDDGFPVELLVHGTIAAGGSSVDVSISSRGKFMTPTAPYIADFSLSLDAGPLDFQQMLMDEMKGAGVNIDDHVIHFSLDDMDAGEQLEYGDGGRGMQDFAKDVFTEG